MTDVTLIGVDFSNYVRTARIACEEKGITHELTTDHLSSVADLKSEAHLAYHPFGRIPVLLHDGFTLFETSAICRYIDENFDGPALVPSERRQTALMEQWISAYHGYAHPAIMIGHFAHYLFPKGDDGGPDREAVEAGLPELAAKLNILNKELEAGPYLLGETPTIADFFLLPAVDYLTTTPEGRDHLAGAPNIARFRDSFAQRPSYAATLPERLKEAA